LEGDESGTIEEQKGGPLPVVLAASFFEGRTARPGGTYGTLKLQPLLRDVSFFLVVFAWS
jgi:hypothetical protein